MNPVGIFEHVLVGAWLAHRLPMQELPLIEWIQSLAPSFTPAGAEAAALIIGLWHEGDVDGDLVNPKEGAPCNGLIDIGAFMLIPAIAAVQQTGMLFPNITNFNGPPFVIIEHAFPPLVPDQGCLFCP